MLSEEVFSSHCRYFLSFEQSLFDGLQNSTAVEAC